MIRPQALRQRDQNFNRFDCRPIQPPEKLTSINMHADMLQEIEPI